MVILGLVHSTSVILLFIYSFMYLFISLLLFSTCSIRQETLSRDHGGPSYRWARRTIPTSWGTAALPTPEWFGRTRPRWCLRGPRTASGTTADSVRPTRRPNQLVTEENARAHLPKIKYKTETCYDILDVILLEVFANQWVRHIIHYSLETPSLYFCEISDPPIHCTRCRPKLSSLDFNRCIIFIWLNKTVDRNK